MTWCSLAAAARLRGLRSSQVLALAIDGLIMARFRGPEDTDVEVAQESLDAYLTTSETVPNGRVWGT